VKPNKDVGYDYEPKENRFEQKADSIEPYPDSKKS
jgi:hypothetical protein